MLRTRLDRCYGNRNGMLLKGKAIILSLSTKERNRILKRLDVHERVLFSRVMNFCYYEGKRHVSL